MFRLRVRWICWGWDRRVCGRGSLPLGQQASVEATKVYGQSFAPSERARRSPRNQNRWDIPACFMMAFAVWREAQFVETVTHSLALHQDWCDPFCLDKEKPCCLSTAITWS